MKLKFFALALSLASAAPALAAPIDHIAGWSIYQNETNCSAYSTFADNEFLGISYDASDSSTQIVFTDADAKSLVAGDMRAIDIYLKHPDGSIDDKWKGTEFTIGNNPDGRRVFVSETLEKPALSDLEKSATIVFLYKARTVAAYDLAGTAAALSAVERCSMRVHHISPKDVFAGEGEAAAGTGTDP